MELNKIDFHWSMQEHYQQLLTKKQHTVHSYCIVNNSLAYHTRCLETALNSVVNALLRSVNNHPITITTTP